MKRLLRPFIFLVSYIEEIVVTICMIGIVLLTFTGVMTRYVWNLPIVGADEIASFMFLWTAVFGAAAGFKYNQHGSVPILADRLPQNLRRIADLIVLAVIAAFFLFLSYYTWHFLLQSHRIGQTSPATGIPVWIVNAGIFAALVLCSMRCVWVIVRDLTGAKRYPDMPKPPLETKASSRSLAAKSSSMPHTFPEKSL